MLAPPRTESTETCSEIDARLALLLRLSVWFDLVEAAVVDVDEAIAEILHTCRVFAPCTCEREILQRMDEIHRQIFEDRLRNWRRRSRP